MKKLILITIGLLLAGTALAITFDNKVLTLQEYNVLKLELKTKVAERNIKPLEYKDAKLWVEMINKNLTNCKLINITKDNLIEKLNACL